MSHMNSSALSDDGKFSTRALRGYGPSDLDFPVIEQVARNLVDGTGISTHVETSDKGSRRAYHHQEERIDEVEEEGSGRTSPPGTIGEAHDYMSENIKSKNEHRIRQNKLGNQSVMGAKDQTISNNVRNG